MNEKRKTGRPPSSQPLPARDPRRARPKRPRDAAKFRYQPLDPAKLEIRLLELSPGKPGSRIVGSLSTVSLLDTPPFEAMSYMWGAPRPTYNISIDGDKGFPIRRNLRKALDDLRYLDRPRILWTDAICINQSDTTEKEHQVKLMRRIYAGAHKVCAWIDHGVGPLTEVFQDLHNLGKGVEIGDFFDPTYWHPVADIFRNPYWRRLWIQQELILATKLEVHCRRVLFHGQELLEFQGRINLIKSRHLGYLAPEFAISRYIEGKEMGEATVPRILYGSLLRARREIKKARESVAIQSGNTDPAKTHGTLLDLFAHSTTLNMTDPRDRVYGLLGIATDIGADDIKVDYSLSVAQTYVQVFQHFIKRYASTVFLCFTVTEYKYEMMDRETSLPSWMPRSGISWDLARASRADGGMGAQTACIDPVTSILSVEGILVDRISSIFQEKNMGRQPILELFPKLDQFCRNTGSTITSQTRPSYERDDITALLFPWVTPAQYQTTYRIQEPTPEERLTAIRDIVDAAARVDNEDRLSLSSVSIGRYTPIDILSAQSRNLGFYLNLEMGSSLLVRTEAGRLGKVGRNISVNPGDQAWVIFGCPTPVLLRPTADNPRQFSVVSPVVLLGLMDGQAIDASSRASATRIELV